MASLPQLPATMREIQDPAQARAARVVDPSPQHPWPGVGGAAADPSLHGSAFSCYQLQWLLLGLSSEGQLLGGGHRRKELPGTVDQTGKHCMPWQS